MSDQGSLVVPHFTFLAPAPRKPRESGAPIRPSLCDAWRRAIQEHFSDVENPAFTVVEGRLKDVDPGSLRCDCIVSPANSFGIMDGGFDLDLSRSFQGAGDIWRLSDHCQSFIHDAWHGFAPPGSCTIVPLPPDASGPQNNPWHAHSIAIVPTMRTPEDVSWHQDLVYNSMWALLVGIMRWNKTTCGGGDERRPKIERVLMTGLGTGQGGIGADKSAQQMVMAIKHFMQPLPSKVRWRDIQGRMKEVENTTEL